MGWDSLLHGKMNLNVLYPLPHMGPRLLGGWLYNLPLFPGAIGVVECLLALRGVLLCGALVGERPLLFLVQVPVWFIVAGPAVVVHKRLLLVSCSVSDVVIQSSSPAHLEDQEGPTRLLPLRALFGVYKQLAPNLCSELQASFLL